jgi:isoleucyl-tRNA synthetase
VHTAPRPWHRGFRDLGENRAALEARGIDTTIPFTVDEAGFFTKEATGFEGAGSSTTRASSATPITQ